MELLGKPLHTNTDNCKKNNVIKNMRLVYKEAKDRASDISQKKKSKFCGILKGKFAEKSADFAGKKSKFVEKSADFAGF